MTRNHAHGPHAGTEPEKAKKHAPGKDEHAAADEGLSG